MPSRNVHSSLSARPVAICMTACAGAESQHPPRPATAQGVYEDKMNVCLAMEVCSGGELFDAIVKKGHYTEKDAAALIRTIVGVVAHCHNMGVIHRDLKPENFLLSDRSAASVLKATDFGLSSFFQVGGEGRGGRCWWCSRMGMDECLVGALAGMHGAPMPLPMDR